MPEFSHKNYTNVTLFRRRPLSPTGSRACKTCSTAVPSKTQSVASTPSTTRLPAVTCLPGRGPTLPPTAEPPVSTASPSPTSKPEAPRRWAHSSKGSPSSSARTSTARLRYDGSTSPSRASRVRPGPSASRYRPDVGRPVDPGLVALARLSVRTSPAGRSLADQGPGLQPAQRLRVPFVPEPASAGIGKWKPSR